MQKTLKVLCDSDTSVMGSIMCNWGPSRCNGGHGNVCYPQNYWTGTNSGSYACLFDEGGLRCANTYLLTHCFSVRCVRYLIKNVFIVYGKP